MGKVLKTHLMSPGIKTPKTYEYAPLLHQTISSILLYCFSKKDMLSMENRFLPLPVCIFLALGIQSDISSAKSLRSIFFTTAFLFIFFNSDSGLCCFHNKFLIFIKLINKLRPWVGNVDLNHFSLLKLKFEL